MPIEIRELVIKATVSSHDTNVKNTHFDKKQIEAIKEDIIEQCLEKMRNEMLKNKER